MPTSGYPRKVYLNGEILDAEMARISVFDRGFIFGDGIYEVMAQINGKFFYREAHMKRLRWCLQEIRIDADIDTLESHIPDVLEASGLTGKDCLLYMQVTRGVAPRKHSFPKGISPTIMMYAWPKNFPAINDAHAAVVTREDFRWSRCDIKMTSLLGNVMANEYAVERGCFETLLERDGLITEASHCNVFFVKEGIVYTHPTGPYLLAGITRQVVLDLCEKLRIPVRLEGIPAEALHNMDEAFLTGTSTQVLAIQKVDGFSLFNNNPGRITQKIQSAFRKLKEKS